MRSSSNPTQAEVSGSQVAVSYIRKPNYYISAQIAEATNQKAKYIKNRGFKDEHYKKMVLDFLRKYGKATKEEIDNLLLDILPDVLDEGQKKNKVRNLMYALHKRDRTIENKGTTRNPLDRKSVV